MSQVSLFSLSRSLLLSNSLCACIGGLGVRISQVSFKIFETFPQNSTGFPNTRDAISQTEAIAFVKLPMLDSAATAFVVLSRPTHAATAFVVLSRLDSALIPHNIPGRRSAGMADGGQCQRRSVICSIKVPACPILIFFRSPKTVFD